MHALGDAVVGDHQAVEQRRVVGRPARRGARSRTAAAARSPRIRASLGPRRGRASFAIGVEQAVDEAALALVVEGVGDVDIFGDDRADRHVAAGEQLVGAGAEDRAHRPVEPLEAPAFGEPRR